MIILANQIEGILSLGGSVSVGVGVGMGKFLPSQLETFAAIAARSGASLEVRVEQGSIIATSQLERIAALGNGRVKFIFN